MRMTSKVTSESSSNSQFKKDDSFIDLMQNIHKDIDVYCQDTDSAGSTQNKSYVEGLARKSTKQSNQGKGDSSRSFEQLIPQNVFKKSKVTSRVNDCERVESFLGESFSYQGSTIKSTLIIDPNKIQYKINITKDKKYQILGEGQKQFTKQAKDSQLFKKQKPAQDKHPTQTKTQLQKMQVISFQDFISKQNIWDQLDKINKQDPSNQTTYMIYRQILNSQSSLDEEINHQEVKEKIKKQSQNDGNSVWTILLAIQQYLKGISENVQVVFCDKSSIKSQVSLKVVSTGYVLHKFKCYEIIKKNLPPCKFQKIASNPKQYKFFQEWYQRHLQDKYEIQYEDIKITSILKLQRRALGVEWDTYEPQIIHQNPKANNNIKVTPYFNKFYLCIEDFDRQKGNITFPKQNSQIYLRGGWPYYLPQNCSRFSIKVWDKFDSGNNEWLSMDGKPNQWPSSFFGLCNSSLKTISNQLQTKAINKQKSTQEIKRSVKNSQCVNKDQQIGQGILCTPFIYNALKNASTVSINGTNYSLVFQCRLISNKIKVTQQQQYWMINKPSDIRPYGIILIQDQVKQHYQLPQVQFGEKFSYQKYKQRIQKNKM